MAPSEGKHFLKLIYFCFPFYLAPLPYEVLWAGTGTEISSLEWRMVLVLKSRDVGMYKLRVRWPRSTTKVGPVKIVQSRRTGSKWPESKHD